jgi:hypothetical protein
MSTCGCGEFGPVAVIIAVLTAIGTEAKGIAFTKAKTAAP